MGKMKPNSQPVAMKTVFMVLHLFLGAHKDILRNPYIGSLIQSISRSRTLI